MLSGRSFRSAFVFSNNSLILSGFPLTFFIQLKPRYLLFRGFILLCVQLSKNITKCLSLYNYSHFQYSFYNQPVLFAKLENVNKLWNNIQNVHANERNQNKNKTKSRHIQIDHVFYCLIQPTNNTMVSLKDSFTVRYQSQKEDFLSVVY